MNSFSFLLKQKRNAIGITQKQLATRLKVPQSTISKLECGTIKPTIELLPALADFMNLSVSAIVASVLS